MSDLLYGIRAKVSPLWGGGTRFIALGVVAGGFVLIADGHIPVGATLLVVSVPVSWLTGMWMIPGSVDAYFVKISNIMNGTITNLHSDNFWLRQQLGDIAIAINRLMPSQASLDLHQRVLADVGRIEEILDDRSMKFADRAVDLVQPSFSLRSAQSELDGNAPGELYAKEMVSLLDRYNRCVDENRKRNIETLRSLVSRAEKVRRPGSLTDRHQRYIQTLDAYMSCMVAYYAATQDSNTETVGGAAVAVEVAYANLEDGARDYFAELLAESHRGHTVESKVGLC